MIIFKKTKDLGNEFDNTEVYVKTDSLSVPDILEDFKNFLAGCGYPVTFQDEIEIKYHNEKEDEDDIS